MNEYPTYTYTQSAAAYSQWIADKYPQLNAEIAKRVNEGRWELVGGMWVEPDLNMPDGESLVRQLLVGQAAFQKIYGHTAMIGWNPDSFGYNWQLPQIYKRSGIDYFVTQKMAWNDTNKLPFKLFWWESPDGSKVLTYFPHDYANQNVDPVRLSADLATAAQQAPGMRDIMDLFGVGDHGGGPTRTMLDQGLHWMEPDKVGAKEEFGTALPYLQRVEKEVAPNSPTWNYSTLAAGIPHSPLPLPARSAFPPGKTSSISNTTAESSPRKPATNAICVTAKRRCSTPRSSPRSHGSTAAPIRPMNSTTRGSTYSSISSTISPPAPASAPSTRKPRRTTTRFVGPPTKSASNSMKTLASHINTDGKGEPVLVFNPLAWERGGIAEVTVQMPHGIDAISLEDERGNVIPSQILSSDLPTHTFHLLFKLGSVPSMGYTVLRAVDGQHEFHTDLTSAGYTLENSALRVSVDPKTGCITSLFDKQGGFEALAPNSCGNELQAFADNPKNYDAWNIDPGTLDAAPTLLHEADEVKMVETGPLRSVLRVTRTWHKSKFVQDLILYADSNELVVHNNFDWHEQHILLKAAFPLAATNKSATYEIPYGTIQRPTTRDNSFEKARFEVPALRWADEGDGAHGLSLLNSSKYGYDAVGNVLRLSLLRGATWPDPVADQGTQIFDYAIYPHRAHGRRLTRWPEDGSSTTSSMQCRCPHTKAPSHPLIPSSALTEPTLPSPR